MLFILDFKAFTDIFHFHGNAFASCCWQMRRVKIVGWRCWTNGCVAFVVLLWMCISSKCGKNSCRMGVWVLRWKYSDDSVFCSPVALFLSETQAMVGFHLPWNDSRSYAHIVNWSEFSGSFCLPLISLRARTRITVWSLAIPPSPFTHVSMSVSVLHEDGMTDVPFEKDGFWYFVCMMAWKWSCEQRSLYESLGKLSHTIWCERSHHMVWALVSNGVSAHIKWCEMTWMPCTRDKSGRCVG